VLLQCVKVGNFKLFFWGLFGFVGLQAVTTGLGYFNFRHPHVQEVFVTITNK
jgi:hypothetical protein